MNYLNGIYVRMLNKFEGWKAEERGSQTLEWIGIAAVVVILVGIVSQALSGESGIGDKVVTKLKGFIDDIGSGG